MNIGTGTDQCASVTAIVPCYRCMDTVERALDSILNQTLQVAEILLVDDASGDGTLDTLYRLQRARDDKRIQVIALSVNSGPGGARNAAWDIASQPWLAFLDADDAWHPHKIELQYSWLIKQQDVSLCAHDTALWHTGIDAALSDVFEPVRISSRKLLFRNSIPTRSVMIKRELPFRFAGKQQAEDYLLWLEIAFSGYACWKMPIALAFSFRPEFSPGGYSGNLWIHEKWELGGFNILRKKRLISQLDFFMASVFSVFKFVRRVVISALRKLS